MKKPAETLRTPSLCARFSFAREGNDPGRVGNLRTLAKTQRRGDSTRNGSRLASSRKQHPPPALLHRSYSPLAVSPPPPRKHSCPFVVPPSSLKAASGPAIRVGPAVSRWAFRGRSGVRLLRGNGSFPWRRGFPGGREGRAGAVRRGPLQGVNRDGQVRGFGGVFPGFRKRGSRSVWG